MRIRKINKRWALNSTKKWTILRNHLKAFNENLRYEDLTDKLHITTIKTDDSLEIEINKYAAEILDTGSSMTPMYITKRVRKMLRSLHITSSARTTSHL